MSTVRCRGGGFALKRSGKKKAAKEATLAASVYTVLSLRAPEGSVAISLPTELYPLQYDGIGLDEIAKKICDHFGISLLIFGNAKEDAAKVFEKTKAQPGQTIKDFLAQLARDRNITLSHQQGKRFFGNHRAIRMTLIHGTI